MLLVTVFSRTTDFLLLNACGDIKSMTLEQFQVNVLYMEGKKCFI